MGVPIDGAVGVQRVSLGRGVARLALPGLAAALAAGVVGQGAYFWPQTRSLAAGLLALSALAVWRGRAPRRPTQAHAGDRLVFLALVALLVGLLASSAANGFSPDAKKTYATLAIAACAYLSGRCLCRIDGADRVVDLIVWIAAGAAAIGIIGVAFHVDRWATFLQGTWRLSSTLTYANAAAALAVLALPLAVVRASRRADAGARVCLALILTGLAATMSRGGIVAAVIAVGVVWIARAFDPQMIIQTTIGAAVMSLALVPAIVEMRGGAPIALAGCAVGLALASRAPRAISRKTLLAGGIVLAACVALVPLTKIGPTRLVPSTDDRSRVWAATIEQMGDHPVFGTGPGSYRLLSLYRGRPIVTRHAHNEYLQAAAETGMVGVCSIGVAALLLGAAIWRARPRARAREMWATGAASCTAFAIHSGLDFLWRVPALIAVVFVLVAVAVHHDQGTDHGGTERSW